MISSCGLRVRVQRDTRLVGPGVGGVTAVHGLYIVIQSTQIVTIQIVVNGVLQAEAGSYILVEIPVKDIVLASEQP